MAIELKDQILQNFGETLMNTCFGKENVSIVILTAQNSVYQLLTIFQNHGKTLNYVFV